MLHLAAWITFLFQFSPSHRGHLSKAPEGPLGWGFNSRPRTEGIIETLRSDVTNLEVSILALAQRASRPVSALYPAVVRFNSRPRTEGIPKPLD